MKKRTVTGYIAPITLTSGAAPPSLITKSASTVWDAFQIAVELISSWGEVSSSYCWFRGVKNRELSLKPGAYWRENYKELEPLIDFTQGGVAFSDVGGLDEWTTYYLAQHHSIPTRLLDWTESFSSALFFAFDGWDGKTTPCIWVMKPELLNETFLGWKGLLAPENTAETKAWLPTKIAEPQRIAQQASDGYVYDNSWPLAIYPKKSNRRINAQQGVFTVHGREFESLTTLVHKRGGNVMNTFSRIDLEGFDPAKTTEHLELLGIRRSAIYPDMDNFVKQLQQTHQWK